jgi:hypothetical protein
MGEEDRSEASPRVHATRRGKHDWNGNFPDTSTGEGNYAEPRQIIPAKLRRVTSAASLVPLLLKVSVIVFVDAQDLACRSPNTLSIAHRSESLCPRSELDQVSNHRLRRSHPEAPEKFGPEATSCSRPKFRDVASSLSGRIWHVTVSSLLSRRTSSFHPVPSPKAWMELKESG